MLNAGDFVLGQSVVIPWNSSGADGASITLATNGTAKVYAADALTTAITTGVTLTEDANSITGRHAVVINTTTAGLVVGKDYLVAVDANTIDGKTVNAWMGMFSIQRLAPGVAVQGLAQAGAATTVTLPATASAVNDYYNGGLAVVAAGTGAGQARVITDYVGSTKVASVSAWATNPDTTSVVVVYANGDGSTPEVSLTSTERSAVIAGIFARTFEATKMAGYTYEEIIGFMSSVLVGKASGLDTTTPIYRNLGDTANAVTGTVDADGNRSAVTRTAASVR